MKYLIIVCNGLSDQPIAEKDNRTPLQLADLPNFDRLAAEGRCGSVLTLPENLPAGNEVSYLSLLGYAPEEFHRGAASFEATTLGLDLKPGETPLCCDFVILQTSHNDMIMKDFTAGQLSDADARLLLDALQTQIAGESVRFYPGSGSHNLMVWNADAPSAPLTPPYELIGEGIRQHMPDHGTCKELVYLMNQAQIILHNHPFNKQRAARGEDPVNSIWFWGNPTGSGRALPPFFSRFEKRAALVSPSLLMQGIARSAQVERAGTEVDPAEALRAALRALDTQDVVYLHLPGAEVASLQGNIDDKTQILEDIDQEVIGPALDALEERSGVRLLFVENHMSSVNLMKYTRDPVPFVVYPSSRGPDSVERFDEEIVRSGSEHFKSGPALIENFFKGAL